MTDHTETDLADYRRASSAALELLEMTRIANSTDRIDPDCITDGRWETIALGLVLLTQATATIAGSGDIDTGLASIRKLIVSSIAETAHTEEGTN